MMSAVESSDQNAHIGLEELDRALASSSTKHRGIALNALSNRLTHDGEFYKLGEADTRMLIVFLPTRQILMQASIRLL